GGGDGSGEEFQIVAFKSMGAGGDILERLKSAFGAALKSLELTVDGEGGGAGADFEEGVVVTRVSLIRAGGIGVKAGGDEDIAAVHLTADPFNHLGSGHLH